MLFPEALFLVTKYPKIIKNAIFLLNFHQKISKISQNFPTICAFCPNVQKCNGWFVKFFEKYAKIIIFRHFRRKSFGIFLKISQQFAFFVQTREKLTHGLLNFLKIC